MPHPATGAARIASARSDVRRVELETPGHGWLYGGVVGLAIDVTAVVLFAVELEQQCCVTGAY